MRKNSIKLNIFLLVLCTMLCQNHAQAGYDIVKATTLEPEKEYHSIKDTFIVDDYNSEIPNFNEEEETVSDIIKEKKHNFFKRRNKKANIEEVSEEETAISEIKVEEEQVKESNKFQINADKITYDENDGNVYANGNVEIIAKVQGVTLKADEAVLEKNEQIIKLKGAVKIIKNNMEMQGESLVVNLNEENIIMDNPITDIYSFTIQAQECYLIANDLQMLNGTITSQTKRQYPVVPSGFYRYNPGASEALYDPDLQDDLNLKQKKMQYKVKAKEIVITSYKDHNSLEVKKSDIYFNNHKISRNNNFEIISDKQYQVTETSSPELGNLRGFGTYFGYGILRKLPKGQTLKIMPAITYGESHLGVGLMGRHKSRNNLLEAGYSSSTERPIIRGLYNFGNGFSVGYGRNYYIKDGFMGARRPGYAAQLGFEKAYHDENQQLTFRHGTYAGMFSDYKKRYGHYFATTRFRHSLELTKYFLSYKNKEQDLKIDFGISSQGSATLYGTGHTLGVIRVGPTLRTKVKKWESQVAYFQTGIHGKSPFMFDQYRYGKANIALNEKFNFNNLFALGCSLSISPEKDNYQNKLLTESRFYTLFGPQNLKFALSYDFVRDIGYMDVMFILGTDSTKIDFEKLTTKDMDKSKEKQDFYKKAKTVKVEDI